MNFRVPTNGLNSQGVGVEGRTEWVDYAKAIGIILVVYGHVARGLFNAGVEFPPNIFTLTDSIIYSFHMPLFFFLSGLFFYNSLCKRGSMGMALSKVDTIVYPYLLWSVLQGGVEVALSNYTNGSVSISEVFSLWSPRAQFWFLYTLFLVCLVSGFIYSLFSNKYNPLLLLVATVLYLYSALLSDNRIFTFVTDNLVFFLLGVIFTQHSWSKYLSTIRALSVCFVFFVFSQYLFHFYREKLYTDKGIETLLLACVSIIFIVSLSMRLAKKPNRLLAYIGSSSMAIYLMHILAASGSRVVLNKLFDIDSVLVFTLVGCLTGIVLPLLFLNILKILNIRYFFSAPIKIWVELAYKNYQLNRGNKR